MAASNADALITPMQGVLGNPRSVYATIMELRSMSFKLRLGLSDIK
jgi:hypothetical protein